MHWIDTPKIGCSGFVQSRLTDYIRGTLALIEFHAPTYYVEITRHVKGYVQAQYDGPAQFRSLEEAKAWTQAVVRLTT